MFEVKGPMKSVKNNTHRVFSLRQIYKTLGSNLCPDSKIRRGKDITKGLTVREWESHFACMKKNIQDTLIQDEFVKKPLFVNVLRGIR